MSERTYRLLLRLLPRQFRERFEAEMLDTARQAAARRGRAGTSAAFLDLFVTAARLWVDVARSAVRGDGSGAAGVDAAGSAIPAARGSLIGSLLQDLRFAVRGLRRDPLFTLFAVGTLGLGIGAGGTMFGIVDRLLLRGPDHVADPDRVVRVYVSHQPADMLPFTSASVGHVAY